MGRGEHALRQIEQHRAIYTCAPPALLTALLRNEALLAQTDISSLRILGSGSAPLAPSLLQGWHDKYGIEIINFYGSNEGIALLGTPKDIPDPAVRAQHFPRYRARARSSRWPAPRGHPKVAEVAVVAYPDEVLASAPAPSWCPARTRP
jgi:acyl-coenzyme A synthetase/AMP-(fatty) acid ligase